jgi:hypothetical protein
MVKWLLSLAVFALASVAVAGSGDRKYPVSEIPEELSKNVNAVVRENRKVYRIISRGKARLEVYFAVTILNGKARSLAEMVVGYDKLSKITDFNAYAYDAMGNQIKKLKNSEIYDQSAFDGVSMYSDDRIKAVDMKQVTFPYTVVFEYQEDFNFIVGIPTAFVLPGEKISLEKFSFKLIYPTTLAPRYKTRNISQPPKKEKTEDGLESLTWELQNVLAIESEPYAPRSEFFPVISSAPSEFEYSGYAGNMTSWKEFGDWIQTLLVGRNDLPLATQDKIKKLAASVRSDEEKVRILYEFLQSKTRYVNISLGMGGLQPFPASTVDKTGYGDCKALSNYMVSMLECAGIKAYYAPVYGGDDFPAVDPNFAVLNVFNHVIVAVPLKTDTIWLECTNQTNPFGYQGSFTGNRKAMLVTEKGGVLANTTRYSAEQNLQSRAADVYINATGDGTAKIKTKYAAQQYDESGLYFVANDAPDVQKKWIQDDTQIPSFDIKTFSMQSEKSRLPSATVNLDLELRRYASVSGKRLFVTPNLMNRNKFVPEKVEQRKSNVVLDFSYLDLDTVRFHLPEGIYPEFLPPPVKLTSRFGEYEASYTMDKAGFFTYTRRLKMSKGTYPAESYNELIDFYKGMTKADNAKVVFLGKT